MEAQVRDKEALFAHIRRTASRALADEIIEKAAIYQRIEPKKDDPFLAVTHRWSIGVETDLGAVQDRLNQMDEARLKGREEAAAMLDEAAARYEGLIGQGACAGVIAHELRARAKAIREKPTQ